MRITPEVLSTTEISSASTFKRLVVEQGRFPKGFNETASYKFLNRVANYQLNLELQFSKKFAESNLKLLVAKVFGKLNFRIAC